VFQGNKQHEVHELMVSQRVTHENGRKEYRILWVDLSSFAVLVNPKHGARTNDLTEIKVMLSKRTRSLTVLQLLFQAKGSGRVFGQLLYPFDSVAQ